MRVLALWRALPRLIALLATLWSPVSGATHAADDSFVIRSAQFAAAPSPEASAPPPASTAWQTVSLPDTWATRWQKSGTGWYRIPFHWHAAEQAAALRFDRLSTVHEVWLNGQLLHESHRWWWTEGKASTVPTLLPVPAAMLRTGANEVLIRSTAHNLAGLSEMVVGPEEAVEIAFTSDQLFEKSLPQALCIMAAALALFMISIWVRLREETAIGVFGALILLGALRNYAHLVWYTPFTSSAIDWVFYLAQVGTLYTVGNFGLLYTHSHWPRYRKALAALCVALIPLSAIAFALDKLSLLKLLSYPPMNVMAWPVVWMCWHYALRHRKPGMFIVALSMTAFAAAAVHDFLYSQHFWPITTTIWLPYALPICMACFGIALISRMVDAMATVSELNRDLELRVAARTHDLVLANKAKTQFIAAASHDLRQPLATAGLLVGMVRERISYPEVRALIDKADAALASMETLLKGLLDISRLDSGSVEAHLQTVALHDLFMAIQSHEEPEALRKGIGLYVRQSPLQVHSDPMLLEQILRNLVGNAIRYTHTGKVMLLARRRGTQVVIEVRDSGVGIEAAQQGLIFEEFYQVAPERLVGKQNLGFGLGLSIVRRLAALTGHTISLRSAPGKGSCFRVVCKGVERRASPVWKTAQPGSAENLQGIRILLMEDDPMFGPALATRLRSWRMDVQLLPSLAALADWLATNPSQPQLIISDFNLLDGDGLNAIALLKTRFGSALPAIVISGHVSPRDLFRLHSSGLPLLHKPFRAEELLAIMQSLLAQANASDNAAIARGNNHRLGS